MPLSSSPEPVAGHSSCRQPSGGTVETISRGGRGAAQIHKSTNCTCPNPRNIFSQIHKIHLHKSTQYTFTNPQIAQTALAQIHEIYFHKSIKCTCTNAQTALAQIHKTFFHKSIKCTNPEIHKKILLQIHKSTKSTFINQKIHKIDFHKSTKCT